MSQLIIEHPSWCGIRIELNHSATANIISPLTLRNRFGIKPSMLLPLMFSKRERIQKDRKRERGRKREIELEGDIKRSLTFADEDVALNVDNVVLGESVHRNFSFDVTFTVCYERRSDLLLRAPDQSLHYFVFIRKLISFSFDGSECWITECLPQSWSIIQT